MADEQLTMGARLRRPGPAVDQLAAIDQPAVIEVVHCHTRVGPR